MPNAPAPSGTTHGRRRASTPPTARRADRHGGDEQVEDELVGGAEQVDDELLGAGRLEGDDEVADGDDRAGGARQDAGEELGDAERERAGGNPGECRPPRPRIVGCARRLGGHALNTKRVAVCIVRRRRHRSCCSGCVAGMVWVSDREPGVRELFAELMPEAEMLSPDELNTRTALGQRPDALVIDGTQFIELPARRRRALLQLPRVLICTGMLLASLPMKIVSGPNVAVLGKPFCVEDLEAALDWLRDPPSASPAGEQVASVLQKPRSRRSGSDPSDRLSRETYHRHHARPHRPALRHGHPPDRGDAPGDRRGRGR